MRCSSIVGLLTVIPFGVVNAECPYVVRNLTDRSFAFEIIDYGGSPISEQFDLDPDGRDSHIVDTGLICDALIRGRFMFGFGKTEVSWLQPQRDQDNFPGYWVIYISEFDLK